jgi:hypothetical protein
MVPPWSFRTYRSGAGRDEVAEWYAGLAPKDRAKVYRWLDYLRQQPRQGWRRPYFDVLHGKCAGLGEIRLKLGQVQWRPIGFFGPDRLQFTVLVVAKEKGGKFIPRDVCDVGQSRKVDVISDRERSDEWFLDPDTA